MRAPLSSDSGFPGSAGRSGSADPAAGPAAAGHLWTAGVCAVLSAVLLALVALGWPPLLALDRAVADGLHTSALESPGWVRANRLLTDWPWDPWAMRLLLTAAVILLLRAGRRTTALWVLFVTLTGSALQQGMKAAVGRPRPQWAEPVDSAHYAAFPSGHAMTATFACWVLVWLLYRAGPRGPWPRLAAGLAVVSVLGVGFTRVYLGVHWLSDVLGGWLLGALVAAGSVAGYEHWRRAASRKPLQEAD
ncbi:phosphatase PAP2 family protein [Streptomyces lycii]|uniref:Phosphatase PAP2 family protein n=1 Tax=Streptomyces lycii TaxID=2654337 RepID=A0ABQ7FQU5_9ACTN|nr:phosphatase PAP2 family protein [Streptomyces lycii]KAF4409717.1 phosphatase PAP2 family protein [Streptomyces lycii]